MTTLPTFYFSVEQEFRIIVNAFFRHHSSQWNSFQLNHPERNCNGQEFRIIVNAFFRHHSSQWNSFQLNHPETNCDGQDMSLPDC
jgi:hypothetical protein